MDPRSVASAGTAFGNVAIGSGAVASNTRYENDPNRGEDPW